MSERDHLRFFSSVSNLYESGPTLPAVAVTGYQWSRSSGALNLEGNKRQKEKRKREEESEK